MGGVWTYALDLARGLASEGVETILATMGDLPTDAQRAEAHAIPGLILCPSRYKLEWMPDCWEDVRRAGDWLLELEERFAPDVVHLNGYTHGALLWHAPVLVVGHSCVLSWWQAVRRETAPAEWRRYQEAVAQGLQSADFIAAPSRAMLNSLHAYYGPLGDADVIVNGRQPNLYHTQAKQPFALTAGRAWDEAKNVQALETIAPRLSWPIYAAGSAQRPDGLGAQAFACANSGAQGIAVGGGFHWLGPLAPSALADWYGRAAIYALPARYEPFGLSALEAALSSCALVLGDIASLREVWGDAALYAPPDDPEALRFTLATLMVCEELRRDMAQRARQRAQRYSLRAMTNAYMDVYGSLMAASELDEETLFDAMFLDPQPEETAP